MFVEFWTRLTSLILTVPWGSFFGSQENAFSGRSASGGALAPQLPRATRSTCNKWLSGWNHLYIVTSSHQPTSSHVIMSYSKPEFILNFPQKRFSPSFFDISQGPWLMSGKKHQPAEVNFSKKSWHHLADVNCWKKNWLHPAAESAKTFHSKTWASTSDPAGGRFWFFWLTNRH